MRTLKHQGSCESPKSKYRVVSPCASYGSFESIQTGIDFEEEDLLTTGEPHPEIANKRDLLLIAKGLAEQAASGSPSISYEKSE